MGKVTRAEKKALKKQRNLLEVTDTCINCNEHIALDQRFCSHCGGKRIYNKLTWKNLIADFADRFLNLENSFLKTFIALFRQPEDVIGGYMNGMRKKYLPAFSYFAIAITVAGITAFFVREYFIDDLIAAQNELYTSGPGAEMQKKFNDKWLRTVMEYQSLFYFSVIPLLALISRLVFWNYKTYNYVEHIVIYLYAYSHIAMITSVTGLLFMWNTTIYQYVGYISLFVMFLYMGYVLKRLFSLDVAKLILKTGLFGLVLGGILVIFAILGVAIGIYLAATGALDDTEFGKQIKKQNERQKTEILKDSVELLPQDNVSPRGKDSISKIQD